MSKNYMIYPLKTMRITQSYHGETSHRPHWYQATDYRDYPIDDGGVDSGMDPIYCPCDEMQVTAIRGLGNASVTNTIWLVSTSPVVAPTFNDVAFMTLTHSNDQDLSRIKVGDIFKRGEVICHEGSNGASSNHIHIVAGKGYCDTWIENSNHKWVMKGECLPPEDVFFLDPSFTKEVFGGSLPWVEIPDELSYVGTPVPRDSTVDQLEVLVTNLRARRDPNLQGEILGYIQPGIYPYTEESDADGYHWYKIESYWIAYQEGWITLYLKTLSPEENQPEEIKPRLIFTCRQTGKYLIYLQAGTKLYLE